MCMYVWIDTCTLSFAVHVLHSRSTSKSWVGTLGRNTRIVGPMSRNRQHGCRLLTCTRITNHALLLATMAAGWPVCVCVVVIACPSTRLAGFVRSLTRCVRVCACVWARELVHGAQPACRLRRFILQGTATLKAQPRRMCRRVLSHVAAACGACVRLVVELVACRGAHLTLLHRDP